MDFTLSHIYRLLILYCTWVVVLGSTPNAVLSVPRTCTGIGGLGYTESSVALKLGYKPGTPSVDREGEAPGRESVLVG